MSIRIFRTVIRRLPTRPRILLPSSCHILKYNSTLPQGLQHPLTPGEIHYHLVQSRVAVSYLPEAPKSLKASTYIGSLPLLEDEEPGLNDFEPNPLFLEVLHSAIRNALKERADDIVEGEALQLGSGWLHIQDQRNIPALGRIGDPDDIIASVRVEDGRTLPETYQPMPSYRLCTTDGPPKLTEGLAKTLEGMLREKIEMENNSL